MSTRSLQEQIDTLRTFLEDRLDAMITKQEELKRQTDDLITLTEDGVARSRATDHRLRLLDDDLDHFKTVIDQQLTETERVVDETQDRVGVVERRLDLLDDSVVRCDLRLTALEERSPPPRSAKRKREISRKPPPRAVKKVKR